MTSPTLRRVELGHRLAASLGAAHVLEDPLSRAAVGLRDASDALIVRPATAAEIAEVVRATRTAAGRLLVVGAGTRTPRVPAGDGPLVVVSMARMTQVLRLDETSLVVQTQAGLTGVALEELLHRRGLTLGELPPAALAGSLGGMLAVRTPGKSSARHGTLEDAVLGLSAVLPDGTIVHTRVAPRRAVGPDPTRALLGAEGQLGVIANAVLRVRRRAEARLLAAWAVPDVEAGVRGLTAALRADARLAACRIACARTAALDWAAFAPPAGRAVVCAATSGPAQLAELERRLVGEALTREGGVALGPELAEHWWRQRAGQATAPAPSARQLWAPAGAALRAALAALAPFDVRLVVSRLDLDGANLFLGGEAASLARATEPACAAGAHVPGEPDPAMASYLDAMHAQLTR